MHPLVDAYIKGRAKLGRTKGKFFDNIEKPKKACSVGAIYYGLYEKASSSPVDEIVKDWPQIRYWAKPPCDDDSGGTIAGILIHLNDFHDAREYPDKKLIEWLESMFVGTAYPTKEDFDKTVQEVQ